MFLCISIIGWCSIIAYLNMLLFSFRLNKMLDNIDDFFKKVGNTLMQFHVYDRRSVERGIVVREAYVLISIRDPYKPSVRFRRPSGLRDVLSLAFHDAEPGRGVKYPECIRLMQEEDAVSIWNFVEQHLGSVGAIVCHCEQGMSRSPAVAWALAEALQGDVAAILAESQPNQFVYKLLRDTIMQLESKEKNLG